MATTTPTHVLLLGSTGRVGQQVLTKLLSQDHHVTALVRKPSSSMTTTTHPNLTLISGTPTSTEDILTALRSINKSTSTSSTRTKVTIISTLGQTRANPSNPWSAPTSPPYFMAQSAQALIDALKTLSADLSSNIEVSRIVLLSMFGTGSTHKNMHWLLRWTMAYSNMRQTLEDHDRVVETIQENFADDRVDGLRIPFVVVRPPMLKFGVEGSVPEMKYHGEEGEGLGLLSGCDVRTLASWIVERIGEGEAARRFDWRMPVVST